MNFSISSSVFMASHSVNFWCTSSENFVSIFENNLLMLSRVVWQSFCTLDFSGPCVQEFVMTFLQLFTSAKKFFISFMYCWSLPCYWQDSQVIMNFCKSSIIQFRFCGKNSFILNIRQSKHLITKTPVNTFVYFYSSFINISSYSEIVKNVFTTKLFKIFGSC